MIGDNTDFMSFQFTSPDLSSSPGGTVDMTGFQSNAFGQPLESSNGYWDYSPNYSVIEEIYPDGNIPDASSTSQAFANNGGGFSGSLPTPSGVLNGTKSTLDYGLKLADSVLSSYAKLQNMQTARYLNTTQADVFRTNAQTAQEVARLQGQAKIAANQAMSNASRSAASLASLGQNQGSFMLYLTILGVVFAGIQIVKSAK